MKRDERNRVDNRDVFAQAQWDFTPAWTATVGLRGSAVRFATRDRFIDVGNPDDSGDRRYHAVNPVLGLAWRLTPSVNLYANGGRGFETPTFTELAYRPVGSGLNLGLEAARSRHLEAGAKWKVAEAQRLDLAWFDIRTQGELVVDTNAGGRSTFKNAGRTSRRGLELSHTAQWAPDWRSTVSLATLRARFDDAFTSGSGATAVDVPAGNRLPGAPSRTAFAELVWTPPRAWAGLSGAAEVVHTGPLAVNDANADAAPAATVLNLRAMAVQRQGDWRFTQLLRLENAGNRRYAGSVIVNDANGRYFEPAPSRHWMLVLTAQRAF